MFKTMTFTNIQKQVVEKMEPLIIPKNVITEMTKNSFANLLETNQGILIIKFGAEWCGPCKKIDPLVYKLMSQMPYPKATCAIIDIDDNFEIYAFLKSRKMVNGVPAILCYKKGNLSFIPDNTVIGSDENQVNLFFQACKQYI